MDEHFFSRGSIHWIDFFGGGGGGNLKVSPVFPDFYAVDTNDSSDSHTDGSNCAHVPENGD